MAATIAAIFMQLQVSEERKEKHLPGYRSYYHVEDTPNIRIPTLLEH